MISISKARGGIGILGLAGLSFVMLGLAVFFPATPRLIWNASASVPRGLYLIEPNVSATRDDLVLVALPDAPRRLAAERSYLPDGVPILKRIAATAGMDVCGDDDGLTVAGRVVPRRAEDRAGRPLPHWMGCRRLGIDEVFLLIADIPDSFDSRYFGPVTLDRIIGKARPLWIE